MLPPLVAFASCSEISEGPQRPKLIFVIDPAVNAAAIVGFVAKAEVIDTLVLLPGVLLGVRPRFLGVGNEGSPPNGESDKDAKGGVKEVCTDDIKALKVRGDIGLLALSLL